jgi:hypothetical protein
VRLCGLQKVVGSTFETSSGRGRARLGFESPRSAACRGSRGQAARWHLRFEVRSQQCPGSLPAHDPLRRVVAVLAWRSLPGSDGSNSPTLRRCALVALMPTLRSRRDAERDQRLAQVLSFEHLDAGDPRAWLADDHTAISVEHVVNDIHNDHPASRNRH